MDHEGFELDGFPAFSTDAEDGDAESAGRLVQNPRTVLVGVPVGGPFEGVPQPSFQASELAEVGKRDRLAIGEEDESPPERAEVTEDLVDADRSA